MKLKNEMQWSDLLNWQRPGLAGLNDIDPARPPWQMDYDRIVFSSAFRRLQDKTQVFPLSDSDYVRTRLTHSLEVSTVARTLGMMAGAIVLSRHGQETVRRYPKGKETVSTLSETFSTADFGSIVAVAALAHDLGNPPFGHSGEDAVRYWFINSPCGKAARETVKQAALAREFELWEGNAQGFRILTSLQLYRDKGGMRLTNATLGAFTKYPISAIEAGPGKRWEKFGFFSAESNIFNSIAKTLGLLRNSNGGWCRHPLAYVMEAADDVCNPIVDFEDGARLGCIAYQDSNKLLLSILPAQEQTAAKKRLQDEPDDNSRIGYLRALAIRELIKQVSASFKKNESQILRGKYESELILDTPAGRSGGILNEIKDRIKKDIYTHFNIVETEAAGFEVIGGLLDLFWTAVDEAANGRLSYRSKKILQRIPMEFVGKDMVPDNDPYLRLLRITDFVTGMTDQYALSLFRKLKGITLSS
ncbi:MAG: dNTP triphosphohydrolase [Cephaloticoccus sp.]|nr:dNTP triphosphohydrolase [Cephaloticoccus sp.]MCF7759393.1 dNTP triphosphohydrolase [Cephaloticoccus sp.]